MTLRVIDGFDYATTGLTDTQYSTMWAAADWYFWAGSPFGTQQNIAKVGRYGFGYAFCFSNIYANMSYTKPIGESVSTGYLGFGLYISTTGVNNQNFLVCFYDGVANLPQFTIQFCANGVIKAYRGDTDTGTLLATTPVGQYLLDQYFQFEVGGTISSSAGYIEVRINTKTVITLNSINTQNTTISTFDSIQLRMEGGYGASADVRVDDLYFCDSAGSINNNFLGTVRVFTQLTAGAGSTTDFSKYGSQPTNWQTVQNKLLDDSQYVYDATNGQYDLYDMQAVVTGPTVHGVQIRGAYRQDDATQVNAHNVLKSGSTQVEGADHLINQTYTYYTDIWELDPNTGVGWLGTNVNLIQAGPKKQA